MTNIGPNIGHNSGDKGISAQRLKSFVSRIERLASEREGLGADIREVYSELKSAGFNPKIVRKVVALRKKKDSERQEEQALLDVYLDAIGFESTPLGEAGKPK